MDKTIDLAIVGSRIRECRECAALSREELGQLAELAPRTIRYAEGGQHVSLRTLLSIASVFDSAPETFWADDFDAEVVATAFVRSLVKRTLEA